MKDSTSKWSSNFKVNRLSRSELAAKMMQRKYAHVSLRNWRKWSLLWKAGDQHVEDLDCGESIGAPTQQHKLIHATILPVSIG